MRILLAVLTFAVLAPVQDTSLRRAKDRELAGLTRAEEGKWQGPFFFIQLADPQFGFMKDRAQEVKNAERAVEHINRLKPRFVVVCGDLTHPAPGSPGYGEELAKFVRIFGKIDPSIPLIPVAGNHDVGNASRPESVATYERTFGEDHFSFWAGGVRCLVINSSLYGGKASDPRTSQDSWFHARLEASGKIPSKHLLVFQHHSWFLKDPAEKTGYFNIPLERRKPALERMKKAGVRAVFAGHYHGNAYGRDGDLEMVTSGPVGRTLRKDPSGLRIVEVREDRIRHAYHPLDKVPASVSLR